MIVIIQYKDGRAGWVNCESVELIPQNGGWLQCNGVTGVHGNISHPGSDQCQYPLTSVLGTWDA
jgi:hypothetical protein